MTQPDPFKDWIEDFRKEVESAVAEPAAPANPAAQRAQEAFGLWWQNEQEPVLNPPPRFDQAAPEIELGETSRGSQPQGRDWPARVERLAEEKAAAQQQAAKLTRDNLALRQRQEGILGEIAEFETKMSRSREGYEGHIGRLETQLRMLEEQVKSLKDNKAFLEKAFERLEAAKAGLEAELKLERGKGGEGLREIIELRQKTSSQEAELSKLRQQGAFQAGALEELRRQAGSFQEGLLRAKQSTDADVALLRQEIRMFVEEFKIIRNTIRKEPL